VSKYKDLPSVIKKAQEAFRKKGVIYSGEGLSRRELRMLWRKKLVIRLRSLSTSKFIYAWKATERLWKQHGSESNSTMTEPSR